MCPTQCLFHNKNLIGISCCKCSDVVERSLGDRISTVMGGKRNWRWKLYNRKLCFWEFSQCSWGCWQKYLEWEFVFSMMRLKHIQREELSEENLRKNMAQHTAEVGGRGSRAGVQRFALERNRTTSKSKVKLDTDIRFAMEWRKKGFSLWGRRQAFLLWGRGQGDRMETHQWDFQKEVDPKKFKKEARIE